MRDMIEKINLINLIIVLFCGTTLLLSVWKGNGEIMQIIASGLIGYLGGSGSLANSNNDLRYGKRYTIKDDDKEDI